MAQLSTCPVSRASATTATPKEVHASIQTLENPARAVPEKYRHQKLNAAQRELIKASLPALQAHGFDITKTFYGNMLESHSELKDIFNNANQKHYEQPRALAEALLAYATHIDDLSPLGPAVELMAAKHASLYVQPEQYAIVGEHLIAALGKVLGDAVTPELAEAWTAAYWQLAEILINRENQLYKASGNWTDWADFKIARKVKESDEVTSFYLEPVDPTLKPLPSFLPGQVCTSPRSFVRQSC
jgi:nitric oxide dioxygenase